ncbi:Npun_R1517 family heterocyst differentiation transcriptional regulator [Leptothoe sp. PORK10 BA2]|uniref:Npun_R1517 family heterocyst differentiation transcriptional regulator n=1 Tax=Leptothoe sp. PORK10 BA2 TaxID=3110254 RepID=UPI002B1F97B1|nr:Npun_R1517 family heterocyst differentiation transcriptional regulator [Leptothoe sp. PORK10 BA2]MEA5462176.1 Npun_R1517 family heterocyst differentiation transcriptional regulator [Leptothoe sp. PORK10 BA2]
MATSFNLSDHNDDVNIYECEVRLKFRIIEDKLAIDERDQSALLESLVDAYTYGDDEYLESLESQISIQEIQALEASPEMRRQLIRLRNCRNLA